MSWDSATVSRELILGRTHTATHRHRSGYNSSSSSSTLVDNCILCTGEATAAATPAYVARCVSAAAVIIITVWGNLLVISSVCHFKQLHTPTNILILSLAVADICVGVFVMPLQFIWLIESCWIFGSTMCAFFNFIAFHLTSTSVHNVALIAVDRYMALSNPFLYSKRVTVNLGIVVASLNWLFSFGYNFALLYDNGFFTTSLTLCQSECLIIVNEIWFFVDLVVVFVLPCSVMFVLYLKIFAIARKHANAIRAAANTQGNPNNRHTHNVPKRSERKAGKVLGILVSVFLLCLVPYYICSFMADSIPSDIFNDVLNSLLVLFYLNFMFNPVIYALFYPWFQKSMKLILTQRVCTKDSSLMQVR